jgi:hypothetical protein
VRGAWEGCAVEGPQWPGDLRRLGEQVLVALTARSAARVEACADELQALRELGTLGQAEPREGDEAVRDLLTRRARGEGGTRAGAHLRSRLGRRPPGIRRAPGPEQEQSDRLTLTVRAATERQDQALRECREAEEESGDGQAALEELRAKAARSTSPEDARARALHRLALSALAASPAPRPCVAPPEWGVRRGTTGTYGT